MTAFKPCAMSEPGLKRLRNGSTAWSALTRSPACCRGSRRRSPFGGLPGVFEYDPTDQYTARPCGPVLYGHTASGRPAAATGGALVESHARPDAVLRRYTDRSDGSHHGPPLHLRRPVLHGDRPSMQHGVLRSGPV